jgi:cyclophilin family peptidyl-prolyl cis-trans isomerase
MSNKKNKSTKSSTSKKAPDGKGGGGQPDSGPQVNWIIVIGAILVVGLVVFFSIREQQQATQVQPTVAAAGGAASGSAAAAIEAGCTAQTNPCPGVVIDPAKQYTATVKMKKGGQFTIQLYADKAPVTVNSFVYLAQNGFFSGVTFHRVLDGFMAQGGDPTGTGTGGPGYQFVNESSDLKFDKAGVVAMANAGANTNGSQFFITFGPQDSLNGGYTIFGQVTDGMDVVNAITRRDPSANPTTPGDAMDSVTISAK